MDWSDAYPWYLTKPSAADGLVRRAQDPTRVTVFWIEHVPEMVSNSMAPVMDCNPNPDCQRRPTLLPYGVRSMAKIPDADQVIRKVPLFVE